MIGKKLKRAMVLSLAGLLSIGGYVSNPVNVLAESMEQEDDIVLEVDTEAEYQAGKTVQDVLFPTLLRTIDAPLPHTAEFLEEDTGVVLYQKNVVRFVTSWNENVKHGGDFKVQEVDEDELPEGVKSVDYSVISDGFEADVDAIAVWDVVYDNTVESLGTLPELLVQDDDVLSGWVDFEGNEVTDKTKPTPGAMYYANFESEIVERNAWSGVLTEDENALFQPAAVVTYQLSEDGGEAFGQFTGLEKLQVDGVDSLTMAKDNLSLYVAYSEDGEFGVLPEVEPVDGYKFIGWMDGNNEVVADTEYKDEQVLTAKFEKIKTATPDDADKDDDDKKDDIHGDINVDNTKPDSDDKKDEDNNSNAVPDGNGGVVSKDPPHMVMYVMHLTDTTGATKDVKVQSYKTLDELADALSYDVKGWAIKQANISEYKVEGSMTIESVVELFKNGDVEVIAYDGSNQAMGCAVAKTTEKEYEYDVLLSKDTNVALRTADEIKSGKEASVDGKGKDENPVTKEGKPDSVAEPVQTSDSNAWMLYLGFGLMLFVCAGGYGTYVMYKKKSDFTE